MSEKINIINFGTTIEVAPGKTATLNEKTMPKVGVCRFIPIGNGEYKIQIDTKLSWVRLRPNTPKELGLGIEYRSLFRLVATGFVLGQKVTPNCWQFSLQSYFDHLERVRNDPEFWEENNPAQNLQKYRAALPF